jgi:hypothetical protein
MFRLTIRRIRPICTTKKIARPHDFAEAEEKDLWEKQQSSFEEYPKPKSVPRVR